VAQLKVFWTESAIRQRNFIFEYWIERNQNYNFVKKLNLQIKNVIRLLKKNPELGKQTDFKNTRALIIGNYSILYQKIDNQIIITGLWDNRQNPSQLLKYLLKK
jgi:plasmid stabilization system protein ParE